ncbi:unnamed protein product [Rotaria sordida]|uniref:Uncharacterized protein n=1 Tax=Rotaria sordida TaxID=392033 RepID=A0A818TA32_9BILA|nr:unnamed protein product [Rotaria sordida]
MSQISVRDTIEQHDTESLRNRDSSENRDEQRSSINKTTAMTAKSTRKSNIQPVNVNGQKSLVQKTKPTISKSPENIVDPLIDYDGRKFSFQNVPPLSLCQGFQSSIIVHPKAEPWKPYGFYRDKEKDKKQKEEEEKAMSKLQEEQSAIKQKPPKDTKTPWYPAGISKLKNQESSKDKKNEEQSQREKDNSQSKTVVEKQPKPIRESEPRWTPAGKIKYAPQRYFDPPGLRWTSKEVKKFITESKQTEKNPSMDRSPQQTTS